MYIKNRLGNSCCCSRELPSGKAIEPAIVIVKAIEELRLRSSGRKELS